MCSSCKSRLCSAVPQKSPKLFPSQPVSRALSPGFLSSQKGLIAVDEGIVAVEGAYVVRYFLGGSGCWVAESEPFEVIYLCRKCRNAW